MGQVLADSLRGLPTKQFLVRLDVTQPPAGAGGGGDVLPRLVPLKMNATAFHDAEGRAIVGATWVGQDLTEVTHYRVSRAGAVKW